MENEVNWSERRKWGVLNEGQSLKTFSAQFVLLFPRVVFTPGESLRSLPL